MDAYYLIRTSCKTEFSTKSTQISLVWLCHVRRISAERMLPPIHLAGRGSRDVEPLIDAWIDGSGRLVLTLGNVERLGVGALRRVRDGGVDAAACQPKPE